MAGYLTSNDIIAAVQRQAAIPINQSTFSNDDILAFANEELKIGLVPSIMNVREEYFVYKEVFPLVNNQSYYPIPYRAIGQKLRTLTYLDASNNYVHLSRISPDDKDIFQQSYVGYYNYLYFYLENNNYVLAPRVQTNPVGGIEVAFFMRPNDLVTNDQVSTIQNIEVNTELGTTTYTVDQIPEGFSTTVLFDLLQTLPGHLIIDYDLTATAINANNNTITFNTADIDPIGLSVNVGDYISLAGTCIIPMCPPELHPVLVQRVVARVLDALGDVQGLNNTNVKIQEMEQKTFAVIDNRVEGNPQKIANNRGLLRTSKMRRRWWY